VRAHEEGVDVVDVNFGFDEGACDFFKAGFGGDFRGYDFGFIVSEIIFLKQGDSLFYIVDDESDNAAISAVDTRDGKDVDFIGRENSNKLIESTYFIFRIDRKLSYRYESTGPGSSKGHNNQLTLKRLEMQRYFELIFAEKEVY